MLRKVFKLNTKTSKLKPIKDHLKHTAGLIAKILRQNLTQNIWCKIWPGPGLALETTLALAMALEAALALILALEVALALGP